MVKLEAELIFSLNVKCSETLDVGLNYDGHLRVIPIVGGTFTGVVDGVVISGGADWNTEKSDGLAHVFAKYCLKTSDGEYIAIENEGVIADFSDKYLIKTTPKFTVSKDSKYSFLNSGVYVGSLEVGGKENSVNINIYRML